MEVISPRSVLWRYLEKVGARLGPRFGIVVAGAASVAVAVLAIGVLKAGGFFELHENTAAVAQCR